MSIGAEAGITSSGFMEVCSAKYEDCTEPHGELPLFYISYSLLRNRCTILDP